jgi:uncharacterized protein (DUF2062 family)
MQIRDTPHAIAGGLAIGVFLGVTPLLGLKTLLALAGAWLSRCSKIAAVLAVTFHDILLPVWPVVLRWQYILGYLVLNYHLPPKLKLRSFHLTDYLHLGTLKTVWPTFVGSLIMAIPLAVICYLVALKVVTRYQERHPKAPAAV